MEVRIIGKPKEIADLIEMMKGRQVEEIHLGVDAKGLNQSAVEAIRGICEGRED